MNINQQYISERNSYSGQIPRYIVIHNTDNYSTGADARAHAMAQYHGNFDGYSAHVYVDDKSAYQAMPYSRGAWHVGANYGGRLFGTVNNRNSVGIEMCVQAGFDYDKAFANTAEVCRQLMSELNIPADRVVQHYDVCAKNCPSAIRAKNDWNRFKKLTQGKEKENSPSGGKEITLTEELRVIFPELSRGCTGTAEQKQKMRFVHFRRIRISWLMEFVAKTAGRQLLYI